MIPDNQLAKGIQIKIIRGLGVDPPVGVLGAKPAHEAGGKSPLKEWNFFFPKKKFLFFFLQKKILESSKTYVKTFSSKSEQIFFSDSLYLPTELFLVNDMQTPHQK